MVVERNEKKTFLMQKTRNSAEGRSIYVWTSDRYNLNKQILHSHEGKTEIHKTITRPILTFIADERAELNSYSKENK